MMNELIKELAADAGYPDYMTYGQDKVLERFAELIVRECACVADDMKTLETARAIKQHFGVEE